MQSEGRIYSLPRWSLTRWLAYAGPDLPLDIRHALVASLFGSLPVFFGGAANTILVSGAIAARTHSPMFIGWFVFEVFVCAARLIVFLIARDAARSMRKTPTDLYLLLGIAWSGGVGYGIVISMTSGDWLVACLACLSGSAMVGGICIRNFGAPRFATAMMFASIVPCMIGAGLSGELLMLVVFAQAPMYLFAMAAAAFKLNKMLVATMLAERKNDHRARHDPLTGLSNRRGLVNAAETRLAAIGDGGSLSLLFLDLDGFKTVNDTRGHAAGDALLKLVAERLRLVLGADDVAARIGGDEFVVLVDGLDTTGALALAENLIAAVSASYALGDDTPATIGLSIGIAMAPQHGSSIEDLLASADAALYEAKSQGKSRYCMASVASNLAALQRMRGLPGATDEAPSEAA